ncbi:carbonic anhydrase [Novipirellula sp. SH528]|uniref:carbonic anhydrase n=1 Tax=Novipirellula sp. SH528 TaxID=3454466 RepID=UPI003F9F22E2
MIRNIKLKRGLHQFLPHEFGTLAGLRESTRNGAQIMMVCCADHGLAADNISFVRPEQCIVIQNMAASVPKYDSGAGGSVLASLAYGISTERVQDVIVCGHLGCRIIPHWSKSIVELDKEDPGGSFNRNARIVVESFYRCRSASERHTLMTCEHLLFQLENLLSHPFMRDKLRNGKVRLHGWVVDDNTARVLCFDPKSSQFVSPERTHC